MFFSHNVVRGSRRRRTPTCQILFVSRSPGSLAHGRRHDKTKLEATRDVREKHMSTANFRCDLSTKPAPLPHFWEHTVGSERAVVTLRADWQAQLRRRSPTRIGQRSFPNWSATGSTVMAWTKFAPGFLKSGTNRI